MFPDSTLDVKFLPSSIFAEFGTPWASMDSSLVLRVSLCYECCVFFEDLYRVFTLVVTKVSPPAPISSLGFSVLAGYRYAHVARHYSESTRCYFDWNSLP